MASESEDLSTVTHVDARIGTDRSFTLSLTSGPDKGRRLTLDRDSTSCLLIGTSAACELRLSDREISRRHASIEHVGSSLRVADLGSTNGTFVDRVRILDALLTGGEILRMGATSIRIDDGPPAPLAETPAATGFGRLVGASPVMRRLFPLLQRLALADVPVVIEGETGTGKEALAEAIHEMGPRANEPFIIFDCTRVASSLMEAELFGHERGAFTGAVARRLGVFEQAMGGTLFIDEIGDLDLALQPKLLRAIERSEIRRLGGSESIHVDVRVLAATRRDLDREVELGRFREDLFHRLAVTRVELPPLRRRAGDIAILARHFWGQLGGADGALPDDLLGRWMSYSWPGNVRELRNAVARYLAIGELSKQPSEEALPASNVGREGEDWVDALVASGLSFPRARDRMLEIFTERYVARLLAIHGGNIVRAAESSGIGRRYFEKLRARKISR